MSTPLIKFLGVSAAEPQATTNEKNGTSPRLSLHGRVTVFGQDGSFDSVRIRLLGAIRTKIGSKIAAENIAFTSITKSIYDFQPVYSVLRQKTEEQYLDFTCPVPSPRNSAAGTFVPSMKLDGTTYLTKVTALSNRELLQGSCEVVYILEAEFLQAPSTRVVRRISCPVDISAGLVALDAELASTTEEYAKPQSRAIGRFRGSQTQPRISVELPKALGPLISDFSTASTNCRRLRVPVSVNVTVPSNASQNVRTYLESGQLKADVKARWYAKRTFNTGYTAVETTIHNDRVSTHNFSVILPPLYQPTSDGTKYTTVMEMDLLVPESICIPTTSTDLLRIGHNLELSIRFADEELSKTPQVATLSLPISLHPAQGLSTINNHTFDPLIGYVEEQFVAAPPPYVY
jgi:hypothetical protein